MDEIHLSSISCQREGTVERQAYLIIDSVIDL
jgi:hypothetical protein